jgi:hypothetical protein
MSGGGGSGSSTNTVQNTNSYIPPWLESYGQQAVQRADALSQQAYNPYTGQTVAGIDPAQQQAYAQIAGMQGYGTGPTGAANTGIDAQAALARQVTPLTAGGIASNTNQLQQGFQQQVYGPAQGLLGNYAAQGPATAQGVAAGAQQLMSPYTQAVVDPANQLMQQQLAQNLHTIGAGANQAGAFGGSRQGVQEGVAQSQAALGSQKYLGDLLNNQWNQATGISRDVALQAGQQGLTSNTALANLLQGGYGANQKLGADIMSSNLSQGLGAAQNLPQSLTSLQNMMLGQSNALNQAGTLQQQYQQQLLNAQQGAFAQQQAFPYQQLQTLLGAVSGIPYSTSNTGFAQEMNPYYSNPYGQAIGGVAALGGLAGGVGNLLDDSRAGNA